MWQVSRGCDKWTCFARCSHESDTFDRYRVAVTNESVSPGVAMKVTRPSQSLRLSTLTSLSTVTYFRSISHSPGQMYTALEWQTPAQYMWRHISPTHQARCTQPYSDIHQLNTCDVTYLHSPGQMYTALERQIPAQYIWRHIYPLTRPDVYSPRETDTSSIHLTSHISTHQARCTQL